MLDCIGDTGKGGGDGVSFRMNYLNPPKGVMGVLCMADRRDAGEERSED